jgi:hypothetical protein
MKNVVVTGCPRADGLRSVLSELGVPYVDYQSYREAGP